MIRTRTDKGFVIKPTDSQLSFHIVCPLLSCTRDNAAHPIKVHIPLLDGDDGRLGARIRELDELGLDLEQEACGSRNPAGFRSGRVFLWRSRRATVCGRGMDRFPRLVGKGEAVRCAAGIKLHQRLSVTGPSSPDCRSASSFVSCRHAENALRPVAPRSSRPPDATVVS